MNKYIIEGNHPILKYINWTADNVIDLNQKVGELANADYEITIKQQNIKETKKLAKKIATELQSWMSDLNSEKGEWVVNPHEFLPANVTCDFAGEARFIKDMTKIIECRLKNHLNK